MSVSQRQLSRNIQENLPIIGGGAVGIGATGGLREFADEDVGPLVGEQGSTLARLSVPSVAWGLGGGAATGILWFMDAGPEWLQDFYLAHTATAMPAGVVSAALPKGGGSGGGGGGGSGASAETSTTVTHNGQGNDFEPAGGQSAEMERAN